jgi:hypothetical protein
LSQLIIPGTLNRFIVIIIKVVSEVVKFIDSKDTITIPGGFKQLLYIVFPHFMLWLENVKYVIKLKKGLRYKKLLLY